MTLPSGNAAIRTLVRMPSTNFRRGSGAVNHRRSESLVRSAGSARGPANPTDLTTSQAGVLNGFPATFPRSGSRSRQFLQAANVVAPQVAAALLAEVAA